MTGDEKLELNYISADSSRDFILNRDFICQLSFKLCLSWHNGYWFWFLHQWLSKLWLDTLVRSWLSPYYIATDMLICSYLLSDGFDWPLPSRDIGFLVVEGIFFIFHYSYVLKPILIHLRLLSFCLHLGNLSEINFQSIWAERLGGRCLCSFNILISITTNHIQSPLSLESYTYVIWVGSTADGYSVVWQVPYCNPSSRSRRIGWWYYVQVIGGLLPCSQAWMALAVRVWTLFNQYTVVVACLYLRVKVCGLLLLFKVPFRTLSTPAFAQVPAWLNIHISSQIGSPTG